MIHNDDDDDGNWGSSWNRTSNTFNQSHSGEDDEEAPPLLQDDTPSENESLNDRYYSLLNIPKDASTEEINKRYRALAIALHPDKHKDDEIREIAAARFRDVQVAHEVLSDKTKRTIYDMFGEEGLKTSWDVGAKFKSAQELREEFEKAARSRQETNIRSLVKSTGDIQCVVNGLGVMYPYKLVRVPANVTRPRASLMERLTRFRLQSFVTKHGFELPTSSSTVVGINAFTSVYGRAYGNFIGTLKYNPSSKLNFQYSQELLAPRNISAQVTYALDPDTEFSLQTQTKKFDIPPNMTFSCGQRLSDKTTGHAVLRTGGWDIENFNGSSFSVGFSNARGWSIEGTKSRTSTTMAFNVLKKNLLGVRLAVSVQGTSQGDFLTSVRGHRKLTQHTKLTLTVDCGLMNGVLLRIKFARLGQSFSLPILLSSEFDVKLALSLLAVPSVTTYLLETYYLRPKRQRTIAQKMAEMRSRPDHAEFITTKRNEADEYVKLMKEQYENRVDVESAKGGLVIVKAIYGEWKDGESINEHIPTDGIESTTADVRIALQLLVNKSMLLIPEGRTKSGLLGFWDPALGSRSKRLYVKYLFKKRLHETIVDDHAALCAPQQAHLL